MKNTEKFVIINADDFGWTKGVNEGIVESHQKGVLTSTTLLANAPATLHAVKLADGCQNLSVGVHLSYSLGEPILPISELDELFDRDGKPKHSQVTLWISASAGKKVRDQLYRHFESQILHVRKLGVTVSHLDTHKHLHFWPAVFDIVSRLAQQYNIPAVRLMNESSFAAGPLNVTGRLVLSLLNPIVPLQLRSAKRYNIIFCDRFIGIPHTGHWTQDMFLKVASELKPGVTEIMTHPGYSADLSQNATRLIESRETELSMLTDKHTLEFFKKWELNNKRINYHQLVQVKQKTR
jgi:predicted glycoside hydrolase/deacetylase ChbG (UPF0249 family)